MITANIFDHAARLRSFEITAEVHARALRRGNQPRPRRGVGGVVSAE